jgi:hypothetical protein
MSPRRESFEEMQRRVTGRPPSAGEKLADVVRNTNWMKVVIPALFFALFATMVLRDVFDEQSLPAYVFVGVAVVVFVVAFLLFTASEAAGRKQRDDDS